jgi:hypothetical protein
MNCKSPYIILIFSLCLFIGCKQERPVWAESSVMCIHWSKYAKEKLKTSAISFRLSYRSIQDTSNMNFLFSEDNSLRGLVSLKKGKLIRKEDYIEQSLYLESDKLIGLFPKGSNYYNDNCFQIELANILGKGKLILREGEKETEIKKTDDFRFQIGPKRK